MSEGNSMSESQRTADQEDTAEVLKALQEKVRHLEFERRILAERVVSEDEKPEEPPELAASRALVPIQEDVRRIKSMPLAEIERTANVLFQAGFMPSTLDTPDKLMAVMLVGKEMGIPPMMAANSLFVIPKTKKVSTDTKTMLAVIYRSGFLENIIITDNNTEVTKIDQLAVTVTITRLNFSPFTVVYTWADAKRANLTGKDTWKKYPRTMLRWRAISEAARPTFPDVIGGLYGWEEMGGDPPFGAEPAVVIEGEVREIGEDRPTSWIEFMRACRDLGLSTREPFYLLDVADAQEATEKYGGPEGAFEALEGKMGEREETTRKLAILDLVAGVYEVEVGDLPSEVTDLIEIWLAENPELTSEAFDLMPLFDEEKGTLKWQEQVEMEEVVLEGEVVIEEEDEEESKEEENSE